MNKILKVSFAAAMLSISSMPVAAQRAGFEIVAPHRAVYDVKLLKASERSGIKSMNGRMVYEIRGNECEGITLRYRFLSRVTTGRDQFLSDQQTATFESADGKQFDFITKSFLNEQLEETIKGSATQTGEGVYVTLVDPKPQEFEFPKASFLTTYLVKLIEYGKKGERFLRDDLYDGSDGADETIATSSVISDLKSVDDSKDTLTTEVSGDLQGLQAWHVAMSYFDKNIGASAENIPVFESSFLLFENGVSSDLVLRYPDYTLSANLSELEMFANPPCVKDG